MRTSHAALRLKFSIQTLHFLQIDIVFLRAPAIVALNLRPNVEKHQQDSYRGADRLTVVQFRSVTRSST
jgi:hypothetical protein